MVPLSLPDYSPSERISEIASLLGAALTRIQSRKSSEKTAPTGESSLHILHNQSAHGSPGNHGEAA
jgi:hypothetical protein